ncbi:MAG TPA: copper resistance protein CopC [Acidimicrobiia bacterium]|jgi:copper transport protein
MKRLLAVLALVAVVIGVWAAPASAHATLESTTPPAGDDLVHSPSVVGLHFDQTVEVKLGGIRVYDSNRNRVSDVGAPEHPGGSGRDVQVSMPKLRDGTYVVTWRVISADSHPVSGAFVFSVGTPSKSNDAASGVASSLLGSQGGSKTLGFVDGIARYGVFLGLTLLVGACAFLLLVWPDGRNRRRVAQIIWASWAVTLVSTLIGFALEGPYGAGLGFADAFKPSLWSDVWGTSFGHIWIARAVLLLAAIPLLRMLLPRRGPAAEHPLPRWWAPVGVVIGLVLCATPGLSGHATTGRWTLLAKAADTLHVGGVALWLGGLVILFAALLPAADERLLRATVPRFSRFALLAMAVIVVTGVFQTFRQVNRLGAFLDTDYGELLLAKILVFLVLMVVAAFSRDLVARRWGVPEEDIGQSTPVVPGPMPAGGGGVAIAEPQVDDPELDVDLDEYPDGFILDEPTAKKRLKRAIFVELAIAAVILGLTAALVNSAPPRELVQNGPYIATLKSPSLWFDTEMAPATSGSNSLHLTALTPEGAPSDTLQMSAQLSQSSNNIAPINVQLIRAGPGHYISNGLAVPFAGTWKLVVRALVTPTNEAVATGNVPIR